MIIVPESARKLKAFIGQTQLGELARTMMLRMVLTFIMHRGRMSCSAAAGSIASEPIHRGELTRFLARPRWQKHDFNEPLVRMLLAKEKSEANSSSSSTPRWSRKRARKRRTPTAPAIASVAISSKGCRYNKKKVVFKKVHCFTFGLLITPSGIRIPIQIPHLTEEYCQENGREHLTTAEAAAQMVRTLPLDDDAEVIVLGDTAYESSVVEQACEETRIHLGIPSQPRAGLRRTDRPAA